MSSIDSLGGFVLGLLSGSFLNVCIARVPYGESIVSPGSRCPQCGHPIRWFDNVPVLSWLVLSGRCRDCGKPISWQYPAVELAAGGWFAIAAARATMESGFSPVYILEQIGMAVLGLLLIALIVIDWQTFTLPDAFTLSGIAAGLFLVCTQAIFLGPTEDQVVLNTSHQLRLRSPGSFAARGNVFLTGPESLIFGRVAAICGVVLLLLLVRWAYKALRHREGMGLGDVKLLGMIAAFLGFWPAILSLFLGVVLATVYSLYLLARRQANGSTRLPFGSFLGLGGLAAAVWGARIIEAYGSLFQ